MPGITVERHSFPNDGHPGGCEKAVIAHLPDLLRRSQQARETAGFGEPLREGEADPGAQKRSLTRKNG